MESFLFKRVRNVKLPEGNRLEDSGIDFFVPVFDDAFIEAFRKYNKPKWFNLNSSIYRRVSIKEKSKIRIPPHKRVLIPSGVYVKIPEIKISFPRIDCSKLELDLSKYFKFSLEANNKSGIATKKGLIYGGSVIDKSYQGEILISLINTTNKTIEIFEDEKIIQFIPYIVGNNPIQEFKGTIEELYKDSVSQRKDGGFGSTGN